MWNYLGYEGNGGNYVLKIGFVVLFHISLTGSGPPDTSELVTKTLPNQEVTC